MDSSAMKYAMARRNTDAINDWIWDDVSAMLRERDPALLAVCVEEYVIDNDLKDDLTDFVGGWQ